MDPVRSHNEGAARVAERRLRQWEIQSSQQPRAEEAVAVVVHPYVALSRTVGGGAMSVAELLSERLGWEVYDKEILEHMAADDGVRRRIYHLMDERRENWLDEILRPIALGSGALRNDYFRRLRMAIATIASHAPAIYVGRGAGLLLPPDRGVHARLVAPRDVRIAAYAARMGVDAKKAADEMERVDREREKFLTAHFGPVEDEAERYDLIINTGRFRHAQAADLIETALRQRVKVD